ncbi:TatD family hydrolase [Paraglaciecola sp.]|uniref:TatD family hydrolase n=1 Tax=Paraglaciecola sp. TaxID=1920173 RepID=UPI0030F3DA36
MHWFDIGVNLTNERFDIEPVLTRADTAGVKSMMLTGTSVLESQKALALCRQFPQSLLYSTAGVHPHYASEFSDQSYAALYELCQDPKVVAVGECGLDFNRNFSTPQQQIDAFERQLELACEVQLPVFLHERDAFSAQIKLIEKYRTKLVGGVVHCFTGNTVQMQAYIELDLFIGITGWVCDLIRGGELREAVTSLPLERMMLETDAPYLRPKGLAKNRKIDNGSNEPAYLPYIAKELADITGIDIQLIKQHSFGNSQTLFGSRKQGSYHGS